MDAFNFAEHIADAVIQCSLLGSIESSRTNSIDNNENHANHETDNRETDNLDSDTLSDYTIEIEVDLDSNLDSSDEYDNNRDTLSYDIGEEVLDEEECLLYHQLKDCGNWAHAKMIISSNNTNNEMTNYLWDSLEQQLLDNNDCFENIQKVYYKSNLDIDIIYNFERPIAQYLIENIKIPSFKPAGYLFNNEENANKWPFKLVVITNKGIYSVNRYITENILGCYA